MKKSFPVVVYVTHGKQELQKKKNTVIYNSISFGLLKESQKVRNLGVNCLRLNFTTESPEQSADILQEFLNVYLHGKTPGNQEYTKGHFKRGAE